MKSPKGYIPARKKDKKNEQITEVINVVKLLCLAIMKNMVAKKVKQLYVYKL
jgi:hypothetical protein